MPGSRKLGRTSDHRKAMLRAMVTFLFETGRIETTVTRAKEVRSVAEKYITVAKQNNLHKKRQVMSFITKESVAVKLFNEIAPIYAEVNGGYTRIIKTAPRRGDAAEMAIIELTKGPYAADKKDKKEKNPQRAGTEKSEKKDKPEKKKKETAKSE